MSGTWSIPLFCDRDAIHTINYECSQIDRERGQTHSAESKTSRSLHTKTTRSLYSLPWLGGVQFKWRFRCCQAKTFVSYWVFGFTVLFHWNFNSFSLCSFWNLICKATCSPKVLSRNLQNETAATTNRKEEISKSQNRSCFSPHFLCKTNLQKQQLAVASAEGDNEWKPTEETSLNHVASKPDCVVCCQVCVICELGKACGHCPPKELVRFPSTGFAEQQFRF